MTLVHRLQEPAKETVVQLESGQQEPKNKACGQCKAPHQRFLTRLLRFMRWPYAARKEPIAEALVQ